MSTHHMIVNKFLSVPRTKKHTLSRSNEFTDLVKNCSSIPPCLFAYITEINPHMQESILFARDFFQLCTINETAYTSKDTINNFLDDYFMPKADHGLNLSSELVASVTEDLRNLMTSSGNNILIDSVIKILELVYAEIHNYFLSNDKDYILSSMENFTAHIRHKSEDDAEQSSHKRGLRPCCVIS